MATISEADFFHRLTPDIIELVNKSVKDVKIVKNKGHATDYATHVDVEAENFIVSELQKHFPDDAILAEEEHPDTTIPQTRIWLIDPICGTNNLGKGINNFCTNVALVDDGEVKAACVVDHSQGEYLWSVGEGKVFVGTELYAPPPAEAGRKVDVDFGAIRLVDKNVRQKHHQMLNKLIEDTDIDLISLNSSLGFAYTAIGKVDGFINVSNHPWDIAAAAFLIQQAGGAITAIDGSPWTVKTRGAIAGHTPKIHQELLKLFLG